MDWLLQTPAGRRIENRIYSRKETLHAPHLLDLEVTQVLRRLMRQGVISAHRAEEAIRDLVDLRITRYGHFEFLPGVWRQRNNFSAYDAVYVVMADSLALRAARPASKCSDYGSNLTAAHPSEGAH